MSFVLDASCSIINDNHVLENQSPTEGLVVSLVKMKSASEMVADDQCRLQAL